MQDFFLNIDYWLFNLINQKGSFVAGDIFFPWITDLHLTLYFKITMIPLLLFFFVKKYKRQGLTLVLILFLTLAFNDFFGSQIKNYFLRPRPFNNSEIISTQKSAAADKSFYSNHASNMFAFATFSGQFFPLLKVPVLVFAFIVAYSRVYNGVHYPSDVIIGSLVGIFWASIFIYLAKQLLNLLKKEALQS